MSQKPKLRITAIPQATLRRLRNTPTYFFLIWRWTWWIYALAWVVLNPKYPYLFLLLAITLVQALIVTLYAPVFKLLLPGVSAKRTSGTKMRKPPAGKTAWRPRWRLKTLPPVTTDEELKVLPPIARSSNRYKNIAIYGLDVLICGLVMYFSAVYKTPPFGDGSPFYRYGFSTVFVAAFAFHYRGGLAAAVGYDLFVILGVFLHPPLAPLYPAFQIQDLLGSLFDAPLIAIFAAYMSTLLDSITRNKRQEQDSVRRQRALLRVGDTLLHGTLDLQQFLQQIAEPIRKGGHFARLILALIGHSEVDGQPEIDTYFDTGIAEAASPDAERTRVMQVARSGKALNSFDLQSGTGNEGPSGIARVYLPFHKDNKDEQVYMVMGVESLRGEPFGQRQENFLNIIGAQLVVALENIRLTEQAAELGAAAERGRVAREIHDGIAQLIYMLSLNMETCAALVQRIAGSSDDSGQAFTPIVQRLDKMVTISKQALWETRHYMFTLKPLISGTSTLTQMLTDQLHEFESISGLPVQFVVMGNEESPGGDKQRARRQAQVGTAIFRITQEALTNAYKHANATQLRVRLNHQPRSVTVEIEDDGTGGIPLMATATRDESARQPQRFYSGHGIGGMRERAEELGGTVEITQTLAGGVRVQARIPLN
ncbi:MAG TPA: GAF domain-containing sensor histidine kinase [Ktedonobacteraceae bacterium]|nr:GAF domain-containing sensor histidine kinase [Ktedonobacteraceae bacterium]